MIENMGYTNGRERAIFKKLFPAANTSRQKIDIYLRWLALRLSLQTCK